MSLGSRFRTLLAMAEQQDEDQARGALLAAAVEHLVPDEARILDHLARRAPGEAVPVVHIGCLTGTGLDGSRVLENASTVGVRAGVALRAMTPHYLRRLLDAGLVALDGEDPRLEDEYRAVLADPGVLAAIRHVTSVGATPRVLRHTLVLTPLGAELVRC
jgi:hypothetical protein